MQQKNYKSFDGWGLLASIDLYDCDNALIKDSQIIRKFIKSLCVVIDMKPVGSPIIGKFGEGKLYGLSAMQFIETSSITIHCDSEISNRVFIDIFSCKNFNSGKAAYYCYDFFKAHSMKLNTLIRK